MTNSELDENELLLITLMRHNPSAEVQILEDGELLSATRAGQILDYIRAMQAEAWEAGRVAGSSSLVQPDPYRNDR